MPLKGYTNAKVIRIGSKYFGFRSDSQPDDHEGNIDLAFFRSFNKSMRSLLFLTCLFQTLSRKGDILTVGREVYISFPYTADITFVAEAAPTISQIRNISVDAGDLRLIGLRQSFKVPATMPVGPLKYKLTQSRVIHSLPEGVSIDRSKEKRAIQPFPKAYVRIQGSRNNAK